MAESLSIMFIIRLFVFVNLIVSFCMFPMDVINYKNHFEDLPTELLPSILIREDHKYTWQNFIHACELGLVCKSWHAAVVDHNSLRQRYNILPMHYAAMMNNPDKIIELKFAGHSPCAPDRKGFTPSHYAVGCGQHDAIAMLNIGLALTTEDGKYIREDDDRTLQILQPFCTNQYTKEDLKDAITENDYKKVVVILSDSLSLCNPELLDYAESFGLKTSIASLLRYAFQGILEQLLFCNIHEAQDMDEVFYELFANSGANPNAYDKQGSTFFHRIAFKPTMQATVQKLLQLKNVDINALHLMRGYSAINACALAGNVECLKQLLEVKKLKNETLSDMDNDAIARAIQNDHVHCVEMLLQYGAAINRLDAAHDFSPLHHAARCGKVDCLWVIMNFPQCNLDFANAAGITPLMEAVKGGNVDCMNMLFARGANGNLVSKVGFNLLSFASGNGRIECLKRLLAMNFRHQINSKSNYGSSPLINAVRRNHLECMKLLIQAHADINACDIAGQTALHFAANNGFDDAVNLLLVCGATINCTSNGDYTVDKYDCCYTPLHFAAKSGHAGVVEILMRNGADTGLKTQLGKTALDLAIENGRSHVVALLS